MKISNMIGLCIIVLSTLILPNIINPSHHTTHLAHSDSMLWHIGKTPTPLK